MFKKQFFFSIEIRKEIKFNKHGFVDINKLTTFRSGQYSAISQSNKTV